MIKRNGANVFAIAPSNNQCQSGRSSVSLSPGAATRIPRATTARMTQPDAHQNSKEANIAISTYVEKWKNRYEESERKHKAHLLKSEKARREHDDLQRRYKILTEERNHLDAELHDRERELLKLRTASEDLYREYERLKNQQEIDAGVMQKVMQQAGEWYKQNKQLKRRSAVLLHALPPNAVDIDLTDSNDNASDSSNEEVEFLKRTVQELSAQVAALQTDINNARLHEFEAHELGAQLQQDLEMEKEKNSRLETELQECRSQLERHNRVSKLLMDEVTELKHNADRDREMAETYRSEARDAAKRVKVLTHQSSLLLGDAGADERAGRLLDEVGALREALEQQAARHRDQLDELQLKLAEKHEDTDILLWEEKIKLAEEDAQKALERAEKAERKVAELERRLADLERNRPGQRKGGIMSRINYFENAGEKKDVKVETSSSATQAPSSPSPLPPKSPLPSESNLSVPPLPPSSKTESSTTTSSTTTASSTTESSLSPSPPPPPPCPSSSAPPPPPPCPPPPPPPCFLPPPPPPTVGGDMAEMLASKHGTLKRTKQNGGGAGIDAIVDQIKGGKFQLKSTDQVVKKPKEEPEAVKEMLQILGTLRKRRANGRPSFIAEEAKN
ncbi:shootin-1-like [Aricia agestis]|uniref:shootin-1-like n=1 Tax=Aricia agestis TaxID=91739 RepID=UPI001C20A283|nr:shootin-1-like [Aricia agestis]XP_041985298.1 shootin-1-like [Aricia agestis]